MTMTTRLLLIMAILGLAPAFLAAATSAAQPTRYLQSDIRVLCLTDDVDRIDWPTLYFLNEEEGCRIDVAILRPRASFYTVQREIPERQLYVHTIYLTPERSNLLDSAAALLFSNRYPDIVLYQTETGGEVYEAFRAYLENLEPDPTRRFNILKEYRRIRADAEAAGGRQTVFVNGRELAMRYEDRLRADLPELLEQDYDPLAIEQNRLVRYELLNSRVAGRLGENRFLAGIPNNRMTLIIEDLLPDGPKKITLKRQAREFLSSLAAAQDRSDPARVTAVVESYRSLKDLVSSIQDDPLIEAEIDLRFYFTDLLARVERTTLRAAGIRWDGSIIVRDSPQGPRLKFRAVLSADGPRGLEMRSVRFHPYWDTTTIPVDTVTRIVTPHQSLVQEYLIKIDRERLEAPQPESLLFTAEVDYAGIPLTMQSAMPVGERRDLLVRFEPGFYFVPPVAELDIDRVVSPMNLRVVISKPRSFSGDVKLTLTTPRGLFAGAYRQKLTLEKGKPRETVRIPYSISKLFELGLQNLVISLSDGNQIVSVDTALVRIASCRVDDKIQVGFLPDTTGRLEDILNMTDAAFRPLTDRGLVTANLDAYDVLLVGSGAFRMYPSFPQLKDRFEEFIRNGGSLVIFGQPEDWPQNVLPVSFAPAIDLVDGAGITNRIPKANLLSRPYRIIEANLLSSFYRKRDVAAAVISPAERVFVTPTGAALLSVSRLGEGQIIYCGLPLTEMIGRLDIDAIHLLANILNY